MDSTQSGVSTVADQSVKRFDTTIAPSAAIAKPLPAKKSGPKKERAATRAAMIAAADEGATKPRPRDEAGRVLDRWNLPMNGPARIRKLAQLGKRDPITNPEDWPDLSAAEE